MSHLYYSTAQKATAVNGCVSGNFSSPDQLNLILTRSSRLEFYLVCPEGLNLVKEVAINGNMVVMQPFRPSNGVKDLLFILTEKSDAFIIEFEMKHNILNVQTKAHGIMVDRVGLPPESGKSGVIDPFGKIIALRVTDGLLKIISLETETELTAFNIRLEEKEIIDFKFLHGYSNPTIMFLYSENMATHIKTSELSLKDKEFVGTTWKQDNVESGASIIIPLPEPLGGAIIVGKETILYHNGTFFIAFSPPLLKNTQLVCYAKVDASGKRHVVGDLIGNLFMLFLETGDTNDGNKVEVKDIKLELLGEIAIPECITYLDNGVLFIGSRLGDSQLIKLNKTMDPETNSYITILDSFVNLAPIVDMVVVNIDGQRQNQIITCSGAGKEGSLRVIRNGITVHELATIELEGIKGIWALGIKADLNIHNVLILSFIKHTKALILNGEDVEETELFGFIPNQQTLYCSNISDSTVLQICESSIRLISFFPSEEILYEWKPPAAKSIDVVSANKAQLVCALGNVLYYLEVREDKIIEKNQRIMEYEVACIDISPSGNSSYGKFVAVGLWNDISIRILMIPSMDEIFSENIEGEIIPRSILFACFDDIYYLFCGLGNGSLLYFSFNIEGGTLSNKNRITLGTQPVLLKSFRSMTNNMVFACSDLPTLIYSFNHKLTFPHVNVPRINSMCSLNSKVFPNSVALVTDSIIMIVTMNQFQKLHIRSIPLGEAPKRIAYQKSSQTLGVVTMRTEYQNTTMKQDCASLRVAYKTQSKSNVGFPKNLLQNNVDEDQDVYNFLLVDQNSFEILQAHQMLPNEYCLSLIAAKLGKNKTPYYVIGTAFIDPEESEPSKGRIIIMEVKDGKVFEIAEEHVKGACFALCEFNGKVAAAIGSSVRLYDWFNEEGLRLECTHCNNVMALYLKAKGDFILIGDIMRSVSLIRYKSVEGNFEEICRDNNPTWMTAIEILDDETFLGGENSLNIFICRKNGTNMDEEEHEMIEKDGEFHTGELVNVIRKGSIAVMETGGHLLGTVSGSLKVLLPIPQPTWELLSELEGKLAANITFVGNVPHRHWRGPLSSFIDGDFVETLLDLPHDHQAKIVAGLKKSGSQCDLSVEELVRTLEDLSRLH